MTVRTRYLVINDRPLPWRVRCCETFLQRARGRICVPPAQRQWVWRLHPCNAVHTLFMAAPIDVAFCDSVGRVLRVVAPLPVRRWAGQGSATTAWEFPAGTARQLSLCRGDYLGLCD